MILIDEKSFKQLFNDYYGALCNFAYRFVNDMDVAEDVVQEVFVRLWQKRKQLNIETNIKNYLFSSVRNKSIEKLRRLKIEDKYYKETKYINNQEVFSAADKPEESEKYVRISKLYDSIDKLPHKCKTIFKMAKIEGMTYNEIATELEISVKTVESQMRRAFILLREMLK